MQRRFVMVLATLAASAAPLMAQTTPNTCPAGLLPTSPERITQDACQKVVDLFQYMAPQLGTAIAGGNATVGGHSKFLGLGVRVNAVMGSVPEIGDVNPSSSGRVSSTYATKDQFVPMPTADASLSVFGGLGLPTAKILGVDLLASATYIPKVDGDEVSLEPDNPLKIGYGVRINAIQESIVLPGVAATYIKRDLPKLTMTGTAGSGSNAAALTVRDFTTSTTSWRVVASKSFLLFGVAAGYGKDNYESGGSATAQYQGQTTTVSVAQTMDRSNMFADLSFNLLVLKVVAEVGQVSGGTIAATPFNKFSGKEADASRNYASVGLRFGW